MSEKKYTEYVCGFYFDSKFQQVVLIWKNKPAWQKGKLNGVGGKIEKEESPITAMRREFHEETGILHGEWVDLVVLTGDDWRVYFFCAIGKVNEFEYAESQEEEEVAKIEVGRLHEYDHIPNLEWLVPMAINKLAYPSEQMSFYYQESPAKQPRGAGGVKASERLPQAHEPLFIKIEKGKSIGSWHPHHEMFIDDLGDFHSADQVEWLDESPAEQPGREVERCAVFVPCTEDDPDCCGGYTSNDGRSLCYVKEVLVPLSAFKQPTAAKLEPGLIFHSTINPINSYEVIEVFDKTNEFKVKITRKCEVNKTTCFEVWRIDGFKKYYELGVYYIKKEVKP